MALVLAASSLSSAAGRHLLEHVRQLHPHAGRALLVPADVWSDQATADAIRDSMALGRIDYYVPRPRPGHRRRRSRRPLGRRLRRLGGNACARGGRSRHRRTGQIERADPQLPRLPDGDQRQPTRRASLRPGGRVRGELPVHASGDRPRPLRPRAHCVNRGRPAGQRESGDPRHGGNLQPPERSLAGGLAWRGSLLRRPGLGGPCAEGEGRVYRRRRELRRPGRAAPCPVRAPRHARRAGAVARRRDVALPRASGRGDSERGGAYGHDRGRRGRRRASRAAGAAQRRWRGRHGLPPTPCSC